MWFRRSVCQSTRGRIQMRCLPPDDCFVDQIDQICFSTLVDSPIECSERFRLSANKAIGPTNGWSEEKFSHKHTRTAAPNCRQITQFTRNLWFQFRSFSFFFSSDDFARTPAIQMIRGFIVKRAKVNKQLISFSGESFSTTTTSTHSVVHTSRDLNLLTFLLNIYDLRFHLRPNSQ